VLKENTFLGNPSLDIPVGSMACCCVATAAESDTFAFSVQEPSLPSLPLDLAPADDLPIPTVVEPAKQPVTAVLAVLAAPLQSVMGALAPGKGGLSVADVMMHFPAKGSDGHSVVIFQGRGTRKNEAKSLTGFGGSNSIKAKVPLLDGTGKQVWLVEFESKDRPSRHLTAQLKSVDGTLIANFERQASARNAGAMFGSISDAEQCVVSIGGIAYATITGNEFMNNCQFVRSDRTGGVKEGAGPMMMCCCPASFSIDALNGGPVGSYKADNDSCCCCLVNTKQRMTCELGADQKLDVLLMFVFLIAGIGTVTPQSGA